MHFNLMALAVPFFLVFIGWEYLYCKRKGLPFYHFTESVANINTGIAERLSDVFTSLLFFYFFRYLYVHFAFFHLQATWYNWLLLFLLTDLVWYWYHRLAHEINIGWAVHVVHHQSEDFNYTVSARITVLQAAVRSLFWSVLPVAGFPPEMITTLLLVHGLYPFFIHTQTIGRLGWLEYVLVTPSHHRVHHASNERYLDKNYGDVLIIWDKLFGTFCKEDEEPITYGLTKPLGHYSFLWQHFHYILELLHACAAAPNRETRLRILFGKPAAMDPGARVILEKKLLTAPGTASTTRAQRQYILWQTGFSLLLLFLVTLFSAQLSGVQCMLLSGIILVSLVNTGAILEQKKWVFYLEYGRLLLVLAAVGYHGQNSVTLGVVTVMVLLLTIYFRAVQTYYERFLFNSGE
ncbi:sterol desaturase family protein [Deminuibacter soli]|uniref:Sterol desaturase family protein n=1 Tax=Deminuibacter soli TaxID=2291815 RepID=A0A3E1NPJ3_9BACT|nr:sterol desaturase family protein [Deminuibacter soli]RFM29708.1 sterol desaturase family protein [Deminuibacter soli]